MDHPRAKLNAPEATARESRRLDLATQFPLRPIRTESEYERAASLMGELLDGERNAAEDDYLEVLSDLVADYEDEHHEVAPATPGDVLRSLIEEQGTTEAEVASSTGITQADLSALLDGKRAFDDATRTLLAGYFGVKPDRLITD